MLDWLWLANARFVILLNHALASQPMLYDAAFFLTGKLADIIALLTFALMWFWPQPRERGHTQLFPESQPLPFQLSGLQKIRFLPRMTRLRWMMDLSRRESRAQFLLLGVTGVLGYIIARLLAMQWNVPRPFESWLPIHAPHPGAFDNLRAFGSFPSDYAVFLAAMPIALLFWDRGLAISWLAFSVLLAVTRIGIGFHAPLDIVGGAAIGVLITYPTLRANWQRGALHRVFLNFARGFEKPNAPYCYLLYGILLLGVAEFVFHFEHVLNALFVVRGELFGH
jgi:membrane-associated phospholipid phosphatase